MFQVAGDCFISQVEQAFEIHKISKIGDLRVNEKLTLQVRQTNNTYSSSIRLSQDTPGYRF